MATIAERRRMARLVHRFGFGPRPGEFEKLIAGGFDVAANRYLTSPASDAFADNQPPPKVSDQGQRPAANSSGIVAYATEKRAQISSLTMWLGLIKFHLSHKETHVSFILSDFIVSHKVKWLFILNFPLFLFMKYLLFRYKF